MASTDFTDSSTVILSAWLDDVDVAAYSSLSSVAGTNTITATGPVPMSAYASGQIFRFIPAATNTGATTINITPSGGSALGAKNIFFYGAACVGGEITISEPVLIVYDGTQFNLIVTRFPRTTTSSTFTWNGSGSTSAAQTLTHQRVGNWVTLHIPAFTVNTGTGSTALTADTAVPAAYRPSAVTQFDVAPRVLNNGVVLGPPGLLSITTAGVITLARDGLDTAFTNSAAAGLSACTFTYFVG